MNKKSIRPIHDNVILRREEPEKMTPGGLHIPDTVLATKRSTGLYGTVVTMGPGHRWPNGTLRPHDVKPGDRVIFERNARFTPVGDAIIMDADEIMAVVEEDEAAQ